MNYCFLEDGKNDEFDYYRRPGLIQGPSGRLIAYYEAQRVRGERRQSLFCRISEDKGLTWSERILLAEGGATGMLHNLMMVFVGGIVHCLWNVQYRQLWHMQSSDGLHWSSPEDLTRKLWRADCDYEWNAFGIGSGHGIVLKNGRVLIPTWWTTGGDSHKPSGFANLYTEDGFQSLGIGAVLTYQKEGDPINPNEGTIVELSNGDVLASVRHDCNARMRFFCVSRGGVEEWREYCFREDLPDPICHASFGRVEKSAASEVEGILFCNCANPDTGIEEKIEKKLCKYNWSDDARKNLTIRISRDEGRTFEKDVFIEEKGGYSDIAVIDDSIVCIYETGWDKDTETCIFPRQLKTVQIPIERIMV